MYATPKTHPKISIPAYTASKAIDFSTGNDSFAYKVGIQGLSANTPMIEIARPDLVELRKELVIQGFGSSQSLIDYLNAVL